MAFCYLLTGNLILTQKKTYYIAIDGKSGSGKTYLAKKLADKLQASVLHLDDYGNDYEPFIGIPKLKLILEKTTESIVIYEGVGVFDNRLAQFADFRILVEVPEDIRFNRVRNRDIPRDDRTKREWQKIGAIWEVSEGNYFTSELKKEADLVVGDDGEFYIEEIASEINAEIT